MHIFCNSRKTHYVSAKPVIAFIKMELVLVFQLMWWTNVTWLVEAL